jgi:hypothetical protein
VNCEPWSEWTSTRCFGLRRHTAMCSACSDIGGLSALHRPAHHAARVEIDHDRQIGKAFQGADVGNVCHPGPIWRCYIELAIQSVVDRQEGLPP